MTGGKVGLSDTSGMGIHGGGAANAGGISTVGSATVEMTGGTAVAVYGGGWADSSSQDNVTGAATVSLSGNAEVSGGVYGGGCIHGSGTSTVNSKTVTVGGGVKIGGSTAEGIVIDGGTASVANGVDSFVIDSDLTENAGVNVNLPAGYDVSSTPTIATGAVEGDLAKINLVGDGATGKEAYFESGAIKVREKSTAPAWVAGGEGTEQSPYVIETYEQLAAFAANVSGTGEYAGAAKDFSGKYIKLANTFPTDSGPLTAAIGCTLDTPFKGHFDGGGKTVALNINESDGDYQGLFGYVSTGGVVKNVTVTGAVKGKDYVGGIAGDVTKGTVQNCVNGAAVTGTNNVGGVAGLIDGSSTMQNCYNTAAVTGTGSNVGGVAGAIGGAAVQNCYNTGAVTGVNLVGGVAGVVEFGSSTLQNCLSLGLTVTATTTGTTDIYVGRVAGLAANGGTLLGNQARADLEVFKNTNEAVTPTSAADGIHGADVAVDNTVALSTVFSDWDSGVWTIPDGNLVPGCALPTLKALAGEAPTLPGEAPASTVTGVTVSPSTATVKKGETQQFSATVTGENDPAQTVTWDVRGGMVGTSIDTNGLLTVNASETANSLTVTATSTVDGSKSGTATVTVTDQDVTRYTLTVTDGSGSGDYAEGAQITVTAETKANQRFKEWTATGITLTDKTANPVTITMPAGVVRLTATYENVYAVTASGDGNGTATASPATAAQGETVTITATANSGYQFKAWTLISGGASLTDGNAASTTFAMPGQAVEVKAVFEPQTTTPTTYTVTLRDGGAGASGNGSYASGATVTISAGSRSGYSFTGWTVVSGSITLANQNQSTTTFEMPAANVEVQANWSRNSTGGSDNGSSNSSSGGSYTPPTITDPKPSDKPNVPTTAETDVTARTDSKGNAEIDVPSKVVDNAIDKALDAAKKNGAEDNGVAVQINVTTGKSATGRAADTITVNLPKATQEKLITAQVSSFTVVVDRPDIAISLNLNSIKAIHTQANADVQLTATRVTDTSKLSDEAKAAIGSRPVFDLSASYRGGKVTSFGEGNVSIEIPYTIQPGELAGNLYAVYVDDNGKVTYLTNSSYDSKEKMLRFATDHFSTYAIGYKAPTITFSDITNHWAKEDIEFVASRGLLNGTGGNRFSPDVSMSRAMFVTALGRLAGIDTSNYKTSTFTDVPSTAYYAPYVEWAASKGIVKGTSNGQFSPDGLVTRQQMAAIMSSYAKAMGCKVPATREAVTFDDSANISAWAADAVAQMQRAGVMMGKDGNRFNPTAAASRAEASAVLRRYLELVIDWQSTQGWTQNDSGSWMYYRDGKPLTGTQAIDGTTYQFNAQGILRKIEATMPETKKHITHKIAYGDTLWDLAQANGCTVAEIMALNENVIENPNSIPLGTEIKIPQK